jgi:hypothetical protein
VPTGDHERVEPARIGVVDRVLHVRPARAVLPDQTLTRHEAEHAALVPGAAQRVVGRLELDVLEARVDQEGDSRHAWNLSAGRMTRIPGPWTWLMPRGGGRENAPAPRSTGVSMGRPAEAQAAGLRAARPLIAATKAGASSGLRR